MPSRLSFSVLSVAKTVEAYVWNIPDGWICPVRWVFYNKRRLAPGAPGRRISPLAAAGAGFRPAGRGTFPTGKYPKDRRGTAQDERIRAHIRSPTPSVASRHLPLTGGVGPGPLLRGYSPNPRWSSSGAWSLAWTVPIPAGPLGPDTVDNGRGWDSPPAPPGAQPTLQGGGGYHSLNHRATCAPPRTKARVQMEKPLCWEIHPGSGSGGGGSVNPHTTRAFAKTTRGA